jgi:hypothetical protein
MKQSTGPDTNATLTSIAEHLTAIEATVAALAVALGTEAAVSKRSADVAKSLRDVVSPQLHAQIRKVSELIADRKSNASV